MDKRHRCRVTDNGQKTLMSGNWQRLETTWRLWLTMTHNLLPHCTVILPSGLNKSSKPNRDWKKHFEPATKTTVPSSVVRLQGRRKFEKYRCRGFRIWRPNGPRKRASVYGTVGLTALSRVVRGCDEQTFRNSIRIADFTGARLRRIRCQQHSSLN